MRPPILSRRLILERPEHASDGAGGQMAAWARLGTLWANVSARTGREGRESGQPVSRVDYRIIVRAAPVGAPERPKAGQRLRDGMRAFRIMAVREHGPGGRYLMCHAQEETAT